MSKCTFVRNHPGWAQYEVLVPRFEPDYLDYLWSRDCFKDIYGLDIFPNMKEITESMGAFFAVQRKLKMSTKDKDVVVIVVGDGSVPRTGTLFSFLTSWTCVSVDPAMQANLGRVYNIANRVRGLQVLPSKVEENKFRFPGQRVVLVFVHSHAKVSRAIEAVVDCRELHAVSIPCCYDDDVDTKPTKVYTDPKILSPHRDVAVYKNIRR